MKRFVLASLVALLVPAALGAAGAAGVPEKLDPRLAYALPPDAAPAAIWIEFVDKGEQGPADLAARFDAARAALTPEALRRRTRAGMSPLVDYLDLPINGVYVEALKAQGFQPFGQSRWFNGCEVYASGPGLARLAALSFVHRLTPAEQAKPRRRDPEPADEPAPLDRPLGGASATGINVLDGQTFTQLARLNVQAVHDSGYIGSGVMVCMLDEGFNYYDKHEATRDLPVGNRTRDFVRGGSIVQDTVNTPGFFRHGEWTLSVLGGNKPGVYIGPGYGATFALARTENSASEKPIEMVNWAMGAEWADSLGADVINSSLGYDIFADSVGFDITYPMKDGHTSIVTRAAEIAASRGILVVNSAGNSGFAGFPGDKISCPADANGDSVLAIGAVDSLGVRSSFSSKGPTSDGRIKPDLSAQGSRVLMTTVSSATNLYERNSGTSFSCPLVAGLAACLIQARPYWPATLIIRALRETATQATHPDTLLGYGIPNGLAALRWTPDTVGAPPTPGRLSFTLGGANPVRPDGWPIALRISLAANAQPANARLRVYDVRGRLIATPWSGLMQPGVALAPTWDGSTQAGLVRAGLYFVSFEQGGHRVTRRLVAVR